MVARTAEFTAEDEGKRVVTASGAVVGEVVHTADGTAFVRPQPELVAGYGSWLAGRRDASALFPLEPSAVVDDGDGRIRIKADGRVEPDTPSNVK